MPVLLCFKWSLVIVIPQKCGIQYTNEGKYRQFTLDSAFLRNDDYQPTNRI